METNFLTNRSSDTLVSERFFLSSENVFLNEYFIFYGGDGFSVLWKNEWLLLSVTFSAKLELVFVLTFKNASSQSFHFKTNRK